MKSESKFRVLFRQFLFRLMDLELLSVSARGDASGLLGQCGALLVSISVLLSWFAITAGARMGERALAAPIWGVERFMVSLTMVAVGLFAVLNWDATFLDRRDVLVLAPLPVRGRTLLAAKVAAAAAALGLTVASLNSLAGFAWPVMLAPPGSGFGGTLRFVAAFWIALFAAGAFVYCAMLGAQAIAAQLPRRWYLRVSSALQLAAFALVLAVFLLQPSFPTAASLAAPENQRALAWLPSYWFMGLLSELTGAFHSQAHAVMAPLARTAVANLLVAIVVAGGAFLLSYLRTLRKVVEEQDIVPGRRGGVWLPPFGTGPQTAIAHFIIRTLLRSRQHRVVLAFYLGGAFAIVALYIDGARHEMRAAAMDLLRTVSVPVLVSTVVVLCASWLGARTLFSLPLDLSANWLFRITPALPRPACLAAVRRALLALSLAPVATLSAALLLWFWAPIAVAQHLLLLALLASVLADLSLRGFSKIPFTCSYLPGKSKVHMVFWLGIVPMMVAIHKAAGLGKEAMARPLAYVVMAAALGAAAFAARRVAKASAVRAEAPAQFEEVASDELIELNLGR